MFYKTIRSILQLSAKPIFAAMALVGARKEGEALEATDRKRTGASRPAQQLRTPMPPRMPASPTSTLHLLSVPSQFPRTYARPARKGRTRLLQDRMPSTIAMCILHTAYCILHTGLLVCWFLVSGLLVCLSSCVAAGRLATSMLINM